MQTDDFANFWTNSVSSPLALFVSGQTSTYFAVYFPSTLIQLLTLCTSLFTSNKLTQNTKLILCLDYPNQPIHTVFSFQNEGLLKTLASNSTISVQSLHMNLANMLSNHSQFDVFTKKSFNSIQLHTIVRNLKQFTFCSDKTKLMTFLQKSLPSPLCHSCLYRSATFDIAPSLSHLPRHYFKALLLMFSSSPQSASLCFFQLLFITIFHSTHLLSIQHTDAEMTVFPITLTSSCLNFTTRSYISIQIPVFACKAPW